MRSDRRYVFVAGCGHSGTSLLAAMLGSHSQVYAIPAETGVFLREQEATQVVTQIEALCIENADRKPIVCEKTPRHICYVERIFATLPESKVLLMIRDGRDVVASLRKRTSSCEHAIERWLVDTSECLRWRDHPNVMLIRYEDLVTRTVATLGDVCGFLSIPFEEAMLFFHQDERNWFGERELKHSDGAGEANHRSLRNWQIHQPLFDGRGRWRQDLTFADMVGFNQAAAGLMEELGYYDPTAGDVASPYRQIPIEHAGVPDDAAYATWDAQLAGTRDARAGAVIDAERHDRFLDEEHHRAYGRPWCIGREYFEFFLMQGIRPEHRFLDFGCGAGRLGISLIRYLKAAHYFGIDAHFPSLQAFAEYEIPLAGLAYKAPRLLHDAECTLSHFATKYDVIADLYTTHHLPAAQVRQVYVRFAEHLAIGGRIFVANAPKLNADELAAIGLCVRYTEVRPVRFLEISQKLEKPGSPIQKVDHWHIIVQDRPHA